MPHLDSLNCLEELAKIQIKRHTLLNKEPLYNNNAYPDNENLIIIGFNRDIDQGLSEDEAELMLSNDIKKAVVNINNYFQKITANNSRNTDLPLPIWVVLIDMFFTVGHTIMSNEENFLKLLNERHYYQAAETLREIANQKEQGNLDYSDLMHFMSHHHLRQIADLIAAGQRFRKLMITDYEQWTTGAHNKQILNIVRTCTSAD